MIAPYAAAHHKLINIEGGLVEASDPGSLPLEYYTRRSLSYSEVVPYDYNQRYTRYKFEDLKTRAYAVLCHLRDHYPSGTVFVLSTHNPVINAIMAIYGHPNKYTTPHRFGEIIGPFEL
jgi:broad specificity phosphatase PhoE